MEDLITIIVLLIFFVIPLIKKIFEAVGGQAPQAQQRKQSAVKDIRKYLEQIQGDQRAGYKAPATRPAHKKSVDVVGKVAAMLKEEEKNAKTDARKLSLEPRVEAALVMNRPSDRNYIKEMVGSQRFSDVQKAVIMSEIFQRPKALR